MDEHHGMQAGEADHQRAGGDDDQLDARDAAREDYCVIGKIDRQREQAHRRKVMHESPGFREGREPAAEEKNGGEAGDGDHVGVFGHEEHGEFEAGIFGVEAADEFGFAFGKIEGSAIGFGDGGHEIAEEADDLRDDVPARNKMQVIARSAMRSFR